MTLNPSLVTRGSFLPVKIDFFHEQVLAHRSSVTDMVTLHVKHLEVTDFLKWCYINKTELNRILAAKCFIVFSTWLYSLMPGKQHIVRMISHNKLNIPC